MPPFTDLIALNETFSFKKLWLRINHFSNLFSSTNQYFMSKKQARQWDFAFMNTLTECSLKNTYMCSTADISIDTQVFESKDYVLWHISGKIH